MFLINYDGMNWSEIVDSDRQVFLFYVEASDQLEDPAALPRRSLNRSLCEPQWTLQAAPVRIQTPALPLSNLYPSHRNACASLVVK
jgi:hypothetical protein